MWARAACKTASLVLIVGADVGARSVFALKASSLESTMVAVRAILVLAILFK